MEEDQFDCGPGVSRREEGEESGDWGTTLFVGSKGSRGWRSLGEPGSS